MKKSDKPINIRKTIYLETIVSDKIQELATKENRTFSSWVALLLKKVACEKPKL